MATLGFHLDHPTPKLIQALARQDTLTFPQSGNLWKKADQIFDRAMDLATPERASFLDMTCGRGTPLRERVERLLGHCDATEETEAACSAPLTPAGGLQGPLFEGLDPKAIQDDHLETGSTVGEFRLLGELGRGGMAVVYLAKDRDGQEVALKRMRRKAIRGEGVHRFRQEHRILATLDHPNIARLLGGGFNEERPYLAMERVSGETISQYCDRLQLDARGRVELVIQVARAVAHAHERKILHRDVKPSNVLVNREGQVKLLDFGIAKFLDDDLLGTMVHTGTEVRVLTPLVASPEQFRGDRLTAVSDVYQLGLLLYQLTLGRWPYRECRGAADLAVAVCSDRPLEPSRAVKEMDQETLRLRGGCRRSLAEAMEGPLEKILLQALAKNPSARQGSAAELVAELEAYLDRATPSCAEPRPKEPRVWLEKLDDLRRTLTDSLSRAADYLPSTAPRFL